VSVPRSWTRLAPGAYATPAGELYLSLPELLAAFGVADTQAHRAILAREIRTYAAARGIPLIEEDDPR
jgi:hypothetical protein